jgi:hypothetical protein
VTDTLLETAGLLAAADDPFEFVAGPPVTAGWVRMADAIAAPSIVEGWFEQVRGTIPNGRKDVAASYLASFVTGTIATPLVRALVDHQRAWRLTADTTWVHLHEDGWLDGIAVDAPVMVLAADRAVGRPDVEVVDSVEELRAIAVVHLASLVDPLFAAIRQRAPYGLRGMWGALADSFTSDLTWVAHVERRDVVDAWASAQPVLDELSVAIAPRALTKPTFERVELDGGAGHLTIRGTCCLFYQSQLDDEPADYCTSCPMGSDETRLLRRLAWLQRDLAAAKD